MKLRLSFVFALLLSLCCGAFAAEQSKVLWYRQPAKVWTEALPIGNGRLAAMVFGGVETERLQINEGTVWAGERRNRNNPAGAAAIPKIRQLLFAGDPKQAEIVADKDVIAIPRRMPPYQTLGDLTLKFQQAEFENCRRDELKGSSTALDEARKHAGKPVTVEGSLSSGKDFKQPVPLDVRAVPSGT